MVVVSMYGVGVCSLTDWFFGGPAADNIAEKNVVFRSRRKTRLTETKSAECRITVTLIGIIFL